MAMATHNARQRGAGDVVPVAAVDTELVTLTRAQPVRIGGPTQAQVPASALDDWLARGWQPAPAPGEADGA